MTDVEKPVYCPAHKKMFTMKGTILQLVNDLQEFHVKSCQNEPHCTRMNHVDCVVGKDLQAGEW